MQDAHDKARHDETALGTKGRGADDVKGEASLHAQQAGHNVKEKMADKCGQNEAQQRHAEALREGSAEAAGFGGVLPENEPKEDAGVSGSDVFEPRSTFVGSKGSGAGNVRRKL